MPTESPSPTTAGKKKIISKDFRTIAVSAIGAATNDNLTQITFGLEVLDSDTMEDIILEEVRLVMTPRTLKVVQQTLRNLVDGLESAMGEIPLGPLPPVMFEQKSK